MLGTRGRARRVRPELAGDALRPVRLSLVLAIADRLPADDRLRLALVSPAFRAVADERSLWRDVCLGLGSCVGRVSDALLLAISAKSRGAMRSLDVSGRLGGIAPALSVDAVVAVARSNPSLQQLDARCNDADDHWRCLHYAGVTRLRAAVPELRRLDADVVCAGVEARALLRDAAVCVRRLFVRRFVDAADLETMLADLEDVSLQPGMSELSLFWEPHGGDGAAPLGRVVDAAIGRRLCALRLFNCGLGADSAAALTRLLEPGCVTSLEVYNGQRLLFPTPAFCAAVANAGQLQRLEFSGVDLFHDPGAGLALLVSLARAGGALVHLDLSYNPVAAAQRRAIGAALGALVATKAASLVSLDATSCELGDAGLRPLVEGALPGRARLRRLRIGGNGLRRPLALALLAAVRANTSLQALEAVVDPVDVRTPELAQAEVLVAARAAAGAAGL